ncbi:MAG: hypothetical protein ACLFP1_07490 [Candidatus Goldiibacteriota bacterium]
MKRTAIFFLAAVLIFPVFHLYADDLKVDPDIESGEYTEEDISVDDASSGENSGDLSVLGVNLRESPPDTPAARPVYFGDVKISAAFMLPAMSEFNALALKNGFQETAYALGFDIVTGWKLLSSLSMGPKISFIKTVSDGISTKDKTEMNFIPASGGLTYSIFLADYTFLISAGAYAGYGFITGKITEYISGAEASETAVLGGGGFYADGTIDINYIIDPVMTAGLSAGFRYAPGLNLSASGSYADIIKDSGTGENVSVDFSGLSIGLNFSMNY